MTYMRRPNVVHPGLPLNDLGLATRDYEGGISTLCAGCGHDSVTSALVQTLFELNIPPHRVAKLSGIGCSSKTPAYFASASHGFNSVHGRMPSVATGANSVNRDLHYIGVSGDGDSLSIGFGQLCHAIRRNVNMLYVIDNNGVYGLTKGQFSASADVGTTAKKGEVNLQPPIDACLTALTMGCTFVARSFSGDKQQLVPLLKAGLTHKGFALIDIVSPCVTFNDHLGSTKSYDFTRQHYHPTIHTDFIPPAEEITASSDDSDTISVELHNGSRVVLRKTDEQYDPTDQNAAYAYLQKHTAAQEVVTGLLFIDEAKPDMHETHMVVEQPLNEIDFDTLCPGQAALDKIQNRFR